MTKSKSLVVGSRVDPLLASQLHQSVITYGAVSAASAIVCGLELQRIKKALKAAGGPGFLEWFDKYEKQLGFSLRTKDKYMAAAAETKAKLLKKGDKATLALLNVAPGNMTPDQRAKLLKAVSKCIGTQTLSDIYLEAGIVKNVHKAPLRIANGEASDDPAPVDHDEDLKAVFDAIGERSLALKKTYKIGNKDHLLIERADLPKLKTAIEILEHDMKVIEKIYKAKGGK